MAESFLKNKASLISMKSYYLVLRPRIPNIFFQPILNEKNPMRPQYLNMPENN